jgi:hypothetical protein
MAPPKWLQHPLDCILAKARSLRDSILMSRSVDTTQQTARPEQTQALSPLQSNNRLNHTPSLHKAEKITCTICLESSDGDKTIKFAHSCAKCSTGKYCEECLKDWFLDATRNESKMPPKCCLIVPLSSVQRLLTIDQVSCLIDFSRFSHSSPRADLCS